MRFNEWKRTRRIEEEYRNTLYKLCRLFKKISIQSGGDIDTYNRMMKSFQGSEAYRKFTYSSIKRMVGSVNDQSYKTWRQAAKKSSLNPFLYKLLKQELKTSTGNIINDLIIQNSLLISTLPVDVAVKTTEDIAKLTFEGKRSSEIAKHISQYTDQHSKSSVRLIARTEVSKTQTALTRARSEQMGARWYVWRTALDGDRVRESHRKMEDVLVNWNNPPSPESLVGEKFVGRYHAGNIWNCRCYPEPLIDIDDVKWPHKVYLNDKIEMVGKREFEQMM